MLNGLNATAFDCDGAVGLRFDPGINVEVGEIVKERGWPAAELKIDIDNVGRVYRGRVSLLSDSGKAGIVKTCQRRHPIPEMAWESIVETLADRALNTQKSHVDPEMVGGAPIVAERPRYQVYPILRSRQPTTLWGDSGQGKSWLAIYLSALVEHGQTHNGLVADLGRVLYLDWETSREMVEERVAAVKAGLGDLIDPDWELRYQRETRPLVDLITDLEKYVQREEIELVIVDSVGLALGGQFNDGEVVLRMFEAIRQLDTTTLLVDHQGKGEDGADRGAIGSSYKKHMSRSVWELRGAEGPNDSRRIGLYHRKTNYSRLHKAFGLSLTVHEDENEIARSAVFERVDVREDADLSAGLSVPQRIMDYLRSGGKTVAEISEDLGIQQPAARLALNRLGNAEKVTQLDGSGQRGGRWGLSSIS